MLWTAFMLGLVGGLHCLGMCGPIAIALPPTGQNRVTYVGGRLLYNLGRAMTYALLGAVFGLLGHTLALAGVQRWVSISIGLLILVSVLLGRRFSRHLVAWRPVAAGLEAVQGRLAALLGRRSSGSMLTIGMLNGFLPCGLVYVALGGATVAGTPAGGALYMFVFGLGTLPLMLLASVSGVFVQRVLGFNLRRAVPVALTALALLFILRGMSLGIPYVSPDLTAGHGPAAGCSCH